MFMGFIALPFSTGEWLAFIAAVSVILIGLGVMILPRLSMKFVGLAPREGTNAGYSEMRGALGGVWVGLGISCILLAQPFTYFALGLAFAISVIGRLISLVFDRSFSRVVLFAFLYEAAVAGLSFNFAGEALGLL